jgi:DNA mismatch repair protein MutS
MHHIQDLHFQKDIIPLLDTVCSDPSRDKLHEILTSFPTTQTEVLQRQEILKALLQCPQLLAPKSYVRLEFNEVNTYIKELSNRDTVPDNNALRFRLMISPSTKQRERGRMSLLFIFLEKIRLSWIAPLEQTRLPKELQEIVTSMQHMLRELDVEINAAIPRNRSFTIQELVRCQMRINEQIRTNQMDQFWRSFHEFEAWLSIARGIHKHQWTFPLFTQNDISIRDCYHPLLKNPVKNDIRITQEVFLLTGPNMSGKSTLLKSIGISIVLASLGLAVPATDCELPFFDSISIAIDLHDDIHSGYSHFMQELMTLKKVLVAADSGKKCFAIFDELFRGTNPEDAFAISQTTITGLTRFSGSYFLISTHLQQLKDTLPPSIATSYIECILENNHPRFTYRLLSGWSDCQIGRLLFEKEGLNTMLQATPIPPTAEG